MLELTGKMKVANNPHRSVLSLTSPAKLNVISSEWSRDTKVTKRSLKRSHSLNIRSQNWKFPTNITNSTTTTTNSAASAAAAATSITRPKMPLGAPPPLLKRNSSFFKYNEPTLDDNTTLSLENGVSLTTTQENDESIDRFIPFLQNNSQTKIDPTVFNDELPPPNASPVAHLRAQTKSVFKKNVAQACGLNMNERILQYVPPPPVASFKRRTYDMKNRSHYNYNQHQSNSNSNSSQQSSDHLIKLRKINMNPERILDAPGFQDDFYLNLLSWSNKNILAIALETSLYLWNATSGDVSLLIDFENVMITSITWSDDDCHISIGKDDGNTEVWDTETSSLVRTMRSNLGVRISSQSWLETLIATGSKSGEIQINDVRIKKHIVSTWEEHEGEVCGLSYKNDGTQLASGGNDNTVMIWDTRTSCPQWVKRNHNAAVKALSWCPYMPNVLASGGGQADRYIHFWNTSTGSKLGSINTGSQVSSLHWGQSYTNKNSSMNREIVATGGNPENAISIFNYDTKFKVAEIVHAHESRICGSQLSPDGTTLATVSGDENLKFYKVFELKRKMKRRYKSGILLDNMLLSSTSNSNTNANLTDYDSQSTDNANTTQPTASLSRGTDYIIR